MVWRLYSSLPDEVTTTGRRDTALGNRLTGARRRGKKNTTNPSPPYNTIRFRSRVSFFRTRAPSITARKCLPRRSKRFVAPVSTKKSSTFSTNDARTCLLRIVFSMSESRENCSRFVIRRVVVVFPNPVRTNESLWRVYFDRGAVQRRTVANIRRTRYG